MKINHLLIISLVSLLVGSCIAFQGANFYRAPAFNPNATFKVITLNSNDGVAGRIEHYLLTNKFRVISDHSLRLPGSTAFPNLNTQLDSIRYSNNPLVVKIPYMEEKPSDYIIRYNLENPPAGSDARSSLNILVANTQTGEAEISFLQEQKGRLEQPKLDRVIQDFIRRLRGQ
jgi:hypothetical protein